MTEDRIIVKVQVSLDGEDLALVYNEDRSVQETFEGRNVVALRQMLQGKPKGFFYAHAESDGKRTGLILDEPAPWQRW